MKKMSREAKSTQGATHSCSKYARKKQGQLQALAGVPLPPIENYNLRPLRTLRVRAVIPNFSNRQDFLFPTAEDGEVLFLSTRTIQKSGFDIRPGDNIECDIQPSPRGPCRQVVIIREVFRRKIT